VKKGGRNSNEYECVPKTQREIDMKKARKAPTCYNSKSCI